MSLENPSLSPSALQLDEVGKGTNGFANSQDTGHSPLQTRSSESAEVSLLSCSYAIKIFNTY